LTGKVGSQVCLTLEINIALHNEDTSYQSIDVLENESPGKLLLLDGTIMITRKNEFTPDFIKGWSR